MCVRARVWICRYKGVDVVKTKCIYSFVCIQYDSLYITIYIRTTKCTHTNIYIYIYIYIYIIIFISRGIDIILIKLPWLENSANTYMRHTEHWIAVSSLLGLISSAYGDPRHGRSNQPMRLKCMRTHNADLGRRSPRGGRVLCPEKCTFKRH